MQAEENLTRLGFQAFLPKCMVKVKRRHTFEMVVRPYFQGYIFIRFDPFVKMWRVGTRGVRDLMMMGGQPSQVPEPVMKLLLDMCNGSGIVEQSMIDVKLVTLIPIGAIVDVALNPLSTLRGKVMLSAHDRVMVLTSIFGRQTEIKVAPNQVEMVA